MSTIEYPDEPTNDAQVDSTLYNSLLLGENEHGSVNLHGSYGNRKSNTKIAYLIGMHPYESKSHRALFETINKYDKKLKYQYYIYNINVKKPINRDTEGRMDGQLLAQEFVAPHIIEENYNFFIDIHSNKGLKGPGKYEKTNFIFAPYFDEKSENIINKILSQWNDIEFYIPEYRTSPEYITVPVAKSGIPTIVYETYSYEKMNKTLEYAIKLVESIDNIKF